MRTASIVVLLSLLACTPKPETTAAAVPEAAGEAAGLSAHTLPSGATFNTAQGWTVEPKDDGARIVGPEGHLVIDVVESTGVDPMTAITNAWASRKPGFSREVHSQLEQPGRDGWDKVLVVPYKTSPEENRGAFGVALTKGDSVLAMVADLPNEHAQRRGSEIGVIDGSMLPAGYAEESYADREALPLDAARLDAVRTYIREAQAASDVPGVAVALFDEDEILFAEGFGVKERGKDDPVTADTRFLIASNTKPLTTLLLAELVDEGKFAWDTSVVDVYPKFRLGDDETTAKVRMEHLVCACTGLPRQDFEWIFTFQESSPAKSMETLGTMQPTTEFGELFQYSNPLAAAAGFIGGSVVHPDDELGAAFDAAMQEKIFDPLGMDQTTFDFDEAEAGDIAAPHSNGLSLKNEVVDNGLNRSMVPVRPAGGAWSTVKDYAKYVQLELNSGRLPDGTQLVTEANMRERWKPKVRIDDDTSYGMGLIIEDVKGVKVVQHGGSMLGYKSNFFLVPELGIGGVMLTNADSGYGVSGKLADRVLEIVYDGTPEAAEDVASSYSAMQAYYKGEMADWVSPAEPELAGMLHERYRNPTLGDLTVQVDEDGVQVEFGAWETSMASKRNPDGTFSLISSDPGVLGFEFAAGEPDGDIETLTLRDPQHTYPFETVADPGSAE